MGVWMFLQKRLPDRPKRHQKVLFSGSPERFGDMKIQSSTPVHVHLSVLAGEETRGPSGHKAIHSEDSPSIYSKNFARPEKLGFLACCSSCNQRPLRSIELTPKSDYAEESV
jgi:hypothetical protein